MKTDDLKLIIRKIIREEMAREIIKMKPIIKETISSEVSKAMGKLLIEVLKESKTSSPNKMVRQQTEESLLEEIEEQQINLPILKTNNPKLNKVLAETARNFKPLPKDNSSLVELMDGGFEKIGKHDVVTTGTPSSKLDFLKQMVGTPSQDSNTTSVLDQGVAIPENLKKVFNRDFRQVLALSKEKHGGYSPNVSIG